MALSVLTLPAAKQEETGLNCGLWDGEGWVALGSRQQMYGIKNIAEQYEQNKSNEEWREKYTLKMINMLTKAGYEPDAAAEIIQRTLKEHA